MLYIKLFIEREKNIGQSAPKINAGILYLRKVCLVQSAYISIWCNGWMYYTVVFGCDHRATVNCSSHKHAQLYLVRVHSTSLDQHPGTLYLLRFVIRQSHWERLGRCWYRFYSDWQCYFIGHGIYVAARAFVTFVEGNACYYYYYYYYIMPQWHHAYEIISLLLTIAFQSF